MSAAVEAVLDSINGFGHSVTSSVATFLDVNHFVASKIVLVASLVFSSVRSAVAAVLSAVAIALEDLFLFAKETLESVVSACDAVFSLLDAVLDAVVSAVSAFFGAVSATFGGAVSAVLAVCRAVVFCYDSTKDFFCLLGTSVLLLVELVPRTVYLAAAGAVSLVKRGAFNVSASASSASAAFRAAPVEMFVGVAAAAAVSYTVAKLGRRLVREHDVTAASASRLLLRGLRLFYVHAVGGAAASLRVALRLVLTTLAHVHAPRFHHAGDSDAEEDEEDEEVAFDASDDEDREQQAMKRRNYELLINSAKKRRPRAKAARAGGEDVEDMLMEQVEREREDKLCVICHDQEKCIMMLPCRHLCVCQGCQFLWRHHQNVVQREPSRCPICRKAVRQTIKAYL